MTPYEEIQEKQYRIVKWMIIIISLILFAVVIWKGE